MTATIKVEKLTQATRAQVYYAFTHAASLTEWMCDYATVTPRPGGRMYLWWVGDFYSAGEYISLQADKSIVFRWDACLDPCPSQVTVTLVEKEGGTLVTLVQEVPEGEYWTNNAPRFQEEWRRTLGNLTQVLETGLDKRIFDRPMLGINMSDFSAEIARSMGVPVTNGIRLDFIPENMGAFKAGLRKDDVLVALDGHPITNDYGSLVTALQGKKGGDKVEAVFYRGSEKMTASLELSRRPVPQIPWDVAVLAKIARAKYDEGLAALEEVFKEVSEAEAGLEPEPGEWSARETLAHLIHNERHWLENLDDVIGGYPRVSDDWSGNSTLHTRATAAAYKTARAMLDEMRRLSDEMVAYLSTLPADFVNRKASYFLTVNMLLEGSLPHIHSHLDQIRDAIVAARKTLNPKTTGLAELENQAL
jgi:uncharacterized protein YndB with AHSA1/START domain